MGLWCQKSVGPYFLLDVSEVDYLAGNLAPTNLRPLAGLPAFVDDIYVFAYLCREDCVFRGGHLFCVTGEEGAAKKVVTNIGAAVQQSLLLRGYLLVCLVHMMAARQVVQGSTIQDTVAQIEKDTGWRARKKWA